ncbi:MAG: cbb3-type cytochrome c oxidase subunit I [Candidatus Kariarchaeaceae archaeon]|jgi:cytochrome c oxidase subunit 1
MATLTGHHHTGSLWRDWKRIFGTTNAQELGKLYFVTSFFNALIAGLWALLIRLELWTPEADYFDTGIDYGEAFTLHGSGMIFLVVVPLGAGFANYLIPRMVAADNNDMYWPKWNNVAFWMLPVGSILIWYSQAAGAWTAYPPLSILESTQGIDMWITGLVFAGTSSTIGALNFTLTIWKARAPYVEWMKLDLFVWGTLLTSLLVIIATPVLTTALVMVLFDRNFDTHFFDGSFGNPTMYQHIFWFYSHPAVYIMVLPAFGLISGIIAKFARRPVFGYTGMVAAMFGITLLSVAVWAHHMYTTGINPFVRIAFTTMTFVIAVPSGIKVFNWVTTLFAGRIKFAVPMLFSLSFIIMFTFGGITGVYVNIIALDVTLHDTYWVVGHFHFVVAAGTLQAIFAAFYYYFPDMTGKMYHNLTAQLHFWFWSLGNLLAFFAFTFLGIYGMPRRYWTYDFGGDIESTMQLWHRVATIGGFAMGLGMLFFLTSIFLGWRNGEKVKDFDNIFELEEGYDFPQPFAEHIKETEGVDLKVEHKLSFWAPVSAFALAFPFLALLAFQEVGFFDPEDGFLKALPNEIMGYLFLLLFVVFLASLFYFESGSHIGEEHVIDKYRPDRNWEIWLFLASEVIFFGALIGTGFAMRLGSDNWPADPSKVLNVPVTAVNTFILICSSFTMAKALESISKGDVEKLKRYLLYTIALGTVFVGIQAYEYTELFHKNKVALTDDAEFPLFSSSFYLQTGFHGAHVTAGIILLIFVYLRARKGGYSKENHQYVEFVGLYWHFVDLVWIMLFTIIYLI